MIPDLVTPKKKELDDWLNEVDYSFLGSSEYVPTDFALTFMNFIKLVNGAEGESHKTPPVHLAMLDKIASDRRYIANLCFRGAAKTTLFMEYLCLYLGVFEYLPGLGRVDLMIYVTDSMENGVKSARKNIEHRYNNSEFLQYWIPKAKFTDAYIEFENREGKKLGIRLFGAKTGIRGTKVFGKRPNLAILDDLVSDEDANSLASMMAIENTVYKGVMHALDPSNHKVIFNGTPFHKEDILVKAVESGGWDVNVWPVCEQFPCSPEEFRSAWPDRFTYEHVKAQYDLAVAEGKVAAFNGELMLRLTSEDDRLIQEEEIRWYNRTNLIRNKHFYNFYITTDFATSKKQTADFTVISVWAYNSNRDWFWVDGIVKRQTMDLTLNDLFRLVQEYQPQSVGIEVTGQQGGFIPWFEEQMMDRNIWFNFASSDKKGNSPGIRPTTDKLSRFSLMVPQFKAGKIFFPHELKNTFPMQEFLRQIRLATKTGLKGRDDFIDTISMLAYLKPWRPSDTLPVSRPETSMWDDEQPEEVHPMASYIV